LGGLKRGETVLFVNQSHGMALKDCFICQSKSWGGLKRGETVLFVNQSHWVALKEERQFYLSIKVMGWT
jgi:phage gp45-like